MSAGAFGARQEISKGYQMTTEIAFSFLRRKSRRAKRLIERSRRYRLRVSLMRNQGMSREAAKTLAAEYKFERKETICPR